ncbi:hypothetical protein C6502_01315 [Candidatus Poribacteria bacterium]|nr:MAG: hypothetical protein C6502_01315 [Candidatus Poribacteria bacterium]
MDVFHPRKLTQIALYHLEEAVLDVLFKARAEGNPFLQPTDISELLDIPKTQLGGADYAIVFGVLDRLASKELIRQAAPTQRKPWGLTNKGIENRIVKYNTNIR